MATKPSGMFYYIATAPSGKEQLIEIDFCESRKNSTKFEQNLQFCLDYGTSKIPSQAEKWREVVKAIEQGAAYFIEWRDDVVGYQYGMNYENLKFVEFNESDKMRKAKRDFLSRYS